MDEAPIEGLPVDFGKFRLVKRIATGGMAEIYLAHRHDAPMEPLVIKRILPHLTKTKEFVSMLLDEARIAAQLHHENIVGILDVGQIDGSYFIAMEYVHGEDIRRIFNRAYKLQRSLPLSHSIRIIAEAARGLGHAHRLTDLAGRPQGVVHRDVSPQNILVTYGGGVKVVDFGIAKAANKVNQTRAGVLKGKYSYMSPEQALGDPIDHRTDIFALGIILYETTTGTRLFKRHNELATLQAIIKCDFIPPSEALPGYPPALERLLLKALAKKPEHRFSDAEDFSASLYDFLRASGMYVEREVIAEFMSDLFSDRLEEEAGSGQPALPNEDEVRAEMVDRTKSSAASVPSGASSEHEPPDTYLDPRFATDAHPDKTVSQDGVLPGFTDAQVLGAAVGPTRPEMSRDPLETGTPPKRERIRASGISEAEASSEEPLATLKPAGGAPDLLPTVAAQPVFGPKDGEPKLKEVPEKGPPKAPDKKPPDRKAPDPTERVRARRNANQASFTQPEGSQGSGVVGFKARWLVSAAAIVAAALVAAATITVAIRRMDGAKEEGEGREALSNGGQVTILTEAGSTIFLGDRLLGTARQDGTGGPFTLPAGSHSLRVKNETVGFERERTIEVQAQKVHEFEARARRGWLRVAAAPWAKVIIDGREVGMTPLSPIPLYEGVHTVRLENPDIRRKYDSTVRIAPSESSDLRVDLSAVGAKL